MSRLAHVLVATPTAPSPGGDSVWRNCQITEVTRPGIIPSTSLTEEMLTFQSGDVATTFAAIVPGYDNVKVALRHPSSAVRKGAARNPLASIMDLDGLAVDPDPTVAATAAEETTRRLSLRTSAENGDVDAAVAILEGFYLDQIKTLVDTSFDTLVAALDRIDRFAFTSRLMVVDGNLLDRLARLITEDDRLRVDLTFARWLLESAPEMLPTSQAEVHKFRRRCSSSAEALLVHAGVLPAGSNVPAAKPLHVPIEAMAAILEPHELSVLFFSSTGPVDQEIMDTVYVSAPASMLVNHLIGQTARRPEKGAVVRMLSSSSNERTDEVSALLEATIQKGSSDGEDSPIGGLPWAGELMLAMRRSGIDRLPIDSAKELFATIDSMLGSTGDAWDLLLALSEEWESTLFDLIQASGRMETLAETVPT